MVAIQAQPRDKWCVTQGNKTAHHNPKRMWEMNLDADRPPYGAPSKTSHATKVHDANIALNAAQRRTSGTSIRTAVERVDPAHQANPATSSGSFTRTS